MSILDKTNKTRTIKVDDMIYPATFIIDSVGWSVLNPYLDSAPDYIKNAYGPVKRGWCYAQMQDWLDAHSDLSWLISPEGLKEFARDCAKLKGTKKGKKYPIHAWCRRGWHGDLTYFINIGCSTSKFILSATAKMELPEIKTEVIISKDERTRQNK